MAVVIDGTTGISTPAETVLGNTAWNKGIKKQTLITALTARTSALEERLTALEQP